MGAHSDLATAPELCHCSPRSVDMASHLYPVNSVRFCEHKQSLNLAVNKDKIILKPVKTEKQVLESVFFL